MAENSTNNGSKNSNVNYESSVSLTKEKSASPGLYEVKDATRYLIRGEENGLVNENTHSSMVIRQNGQINLASNTYAQYKLNPSGKAIEESLESVTITNRKKYSTDDMVINEHKLNPFLYEITDMKELSCHYNDKMLVGNFTMFGTVLVKAWEPELKRYVLIRRLARMPMFSPLLNVPEINSALNISDPLKVDHNILAKSDRGYQVNKPLHDKASLIGKAGVDRAGINRNNLQGVADGSSGGNMFNGKISGNSNSEKVWNALIGAGFTAQGAAGLMGNFERECGFNIELKEDQGDGGGTDFNVNDGHGYGLAQWTDAGRKQGLLNKANAMKLSVADIRVQISYLMDEMSNMVIDKDTCTAAYYGHRCTACEKYDGRSLLDICKSSTNYVESTTVFHDTFERSADYSPNQHGGIEGRIEFAKEYLNKYGNKK